MIFLQRIMKYRIRFLTPAFLGNAEQSGQWRTPPFKALLRQWWRVVYAANHNYPEDTAEMRQDEGRLFGNAWIKDDFRKSAVRLRLSTWDGGRATGERWRFDHDDHASHAGRQPDNRRTTGHREAHGNAAIRHPEVVPPIDPLLYLGYGPLVFKGGTVLKRNAAIQAGETAELSIAAPEPNIVDIRTAMALMNAYGTVGGRSRNGWGSFVLEPSDGTSGTNAARTVPPANEGDAVRRCVRPWGDALALDWPHAIGRDGAGPLVWQTTKPYADWKALMRDLAILKIGLRTMFLFPSSEPPHPRHWLSYPITNHPVGLWGHQGLRLPNSLRFKVRPDSSDPERLRRGVVFHVPCLPPADFNPDPRAIEDVWQRTHELLDELTQPPGRRRYMMIDDDNERRTTLKPSLDSLTLERSSE